MTEKEKQYILNVSYPFTGEFMENQKAIEAQLNLGRAQWSGAGGFGGKSMRDLGWDITEAQRVAVESVLKAIALNSKEFEWEIRIYDDTND